jgi:methyl-accepting chemotaxis protein
MTETSRTIMAGDLSGRLPVGGSEDELDRLAVNLNLMLERIEALMRGFKEVSDNIAHDPRRRSRGFATAPRARCAPAGTRVTIARRWNRPSRSRTS